MNQGKFVFSQLMSLISHNDFNACVERYDGDYKVKEFTCWKQFLCMAFGQLTHRESLSDTVLSVKFKDFESGKVFVFLTNNENHTAEEIAQLYKYRWKIELFFKWIKQHLKIKSFWGTSVNAVKTQVWIAIIVYVLILIAKRKYKIEQTIYEMLQLFSITSLERTSINELFASENLNKNEPIKANQLKMF